jgi:hypothetical protein
MSAKGARAGESSDAERKSIPVYDPLGMQIVESECDFSHVEPDGVLLDLPQPVEMEPQVAAKHEVDDHEEVLVVLERISEVAHEWVVNLLEQPPFL